MTRLIANLVLILLVSGPLHTASAHPDHENPMDGFHESIQAREAIEDSVRSFFAVNDAREWTKLGDLIASPFRIDFSSFGGESLDNLQAAEAMEYLKDRLTGFETAKHFVGPVDVLLTGNSATASTTVSATREIPDVDEESSSQLEGRYEFRLSRYGSQWKFHALTFRFSSVSAASPVTSKQYR